MSQHALHSTAPELRAAGTELQGAVEQTRLSGFTKTWTHLLAAAAALVFAVTTDGQVSPGEALQLVVIGLTAIITWVLPGTWFKTAGTLLGAAGSAALPLLSERWADLSSINLTLVGAAVLGALASLLLPNATTGALPATQPSPLPDDIEPIAPGTALQLLIDGTPVSAVITGPTPTVPAAAAPASPTPASGEQDGPTVPAVPGHVSDAVQRLRSQPQISTQTTATASPTRSTPIRSGYTPAGSGATGVLPAQPAPESEDPQGPPSRGYSFGSP